MQHRRTTIPLSVYVPADSPIHRLQPRTKIVLLIAFILATSIFCTTIPRAVIAVALIIALYPTARIPISIAWSQARGALVFLVLLAGFQWWENGGEQALVIFLSLLAAMLAAFLLTLTSTVNAILESLENSLRPLERFGLPVDTISLAMALTIRLIPLMFETAYEVLDARKARGAGLSLSAFATPIIIRAIRRARAMGEALHARGVGD